MMRQLCLDYLDDPTPAGWDKLTSEERRFVGRKGGTVPKAKAAPAPIKVESPKAAKSAKK